MLLALDMNDERDFSFIDHSADSSIQSINAETIKRAKSAKINSATRFLCIIVSKTSSSGWVIWEIDKAKDLNKKLVAAKTTSNKKIPSGLINRGQCHSHSALSRKQLMTRKLDGERY